MHFLRLSLAVLAFSLAGCAGIREAFDPNNRDMTPLDGTGERPNIRNRFPESHGGLPLSRADREDRDMTPMQQLQQY